MFRYMMMNDAALKRCASECRDIYWIVLALDAVSIASNPQTFNAVITEETLPGSSSQFPFEEGPHSLHCMSNRQNVQ